MTKRKRLAIIDKTLHRTGFNSVVAFLCLKALCLSGELLVFVFMFSIYTIYFCVIFHCKIGEKKKQSMKTEISNLVHRTGFRINFHQVTLQVKIGECQII